MASFSWVKISANSYEQKYGFMERFFVRFLGEEGKATPFTIIAALELVVGSTPIDAFESRLRETWRALRFHHPGIAGLSGSSGKIYTVPTTVEAVSEWEHASFKRHSPGTTGDDIYGAAQRATMMTLHFLPNATDTSHQLVLQAEHQHIDGRGVFYIFDAFLTIFTTPSLRDPSVVIFGEEWTRLPPAMDDLMCLPPAPSEEDISAARKWLSPLAQISPVAVPDPTPEQLGDSSPEQLSPQSRSIRLAVRLSQSETSAVLAACKLHNMTVTSAWLAALALALGNHTTPDKTAPPLGLTTFSTIDMRRYFPSNGTFDANKQIACYHAFMPVALELPPPNKEKGGLITLATRTTQDLHPPSSIKGSYPTVIQLLGDRISTADPMKSAGLVSPLGVIDQYLKKTYGSGEMQVNVKDVWIADTMMGGTKLWMVHTWDGRLCLSVLYDEAKFGRGRMEWVLERVKGEMVVGLERGV
ncbi:hypothetical protein B0T14DRAFT_500913 [Immersiella caudata]|uniref:Acyltransferase n=1 Tax=Immersiella caudata TaxID=314043 RepID=A0AA39T1X4_9PEZI|nr:hypothetical protein B0T14DRAFT_500913 [Immersiella caudata]